ncbi:MAG TPA: hypothetical protein VFC84_14775 [Desulfosporosinus sp.]|nr:hypothetical protein [Desulfosporosinus sp.]
MQKRTKIITGVLSAALLVGGVGIAIAYNYPELLTAPLTSTKAPVQHEAAYRGTLELPIAANMRAGTYSGWISDGKANGGGKIVFEDGNEWDGIFVDNIAVGVGLITYHIEGRPDNIKTVDADLSKGIGTPAL